MNDFVTSHEKISDKIKIDNTYNYSVLTTLGIAKCGDYYIKLEFIDLSDDDIDDLIHLSRIPFCLKFSSELVKKLDYNITHIIVKEYSISKVGVVYWHCLSDNVEPQELI
jgi:hypothetical protein